MSSNLSGFTREDPWRIFRIMAEFVDSFETLSQVGPAVTISVRRVCLRAIPFIKLR